MAYWEKFCHLSYWQQLIANDFNRGYLAALALVFAFLLVILLLKFLLWLLFRTRRCGSVVVESPDGEVVISRDAVTALLRRELSEFSQLEVRTIRILRRGRRYFLRLYADFRTGGKGLQAVLDEVKPRLLDSLRETFGITCVKKIKVTIEELIDTGDSGKSSPAEPETETPPADRSAAPEVTVRPPDVF